MEDRISSLRDALRQLLAAASTETSDGGPRSPEMEAALEHAAKALICERALAGRPWSAPDYKSSSFLTRWRQLKRIAPAAAELQLQPASGS